MIPYRKRSAPGAPAPGVRRLQILHAEPSDGSGDRASRSVSPAPWSPLASDERRPQMAVAATAPKSATIVRRRGRSIAIAARVMMLAGDAAAGLLLSQIIYWTQRGVDVLERDGWIYKTAHDWELETGMSWKVQRRARQVLTALDLIEERKDGMPARLQFRLNLSTLCRLLAERADVEIGELDLPTFRNCQGRGGDALLGRSFLFHGVLAQIFPVATAMMCSRLLVPVNPPSLDPRALRQAASSSPPRFVALHRDRWRAETGLTRDQWQTARKVLGEVGVLFERRHNFPRRIELALNLHALADVLLAGKASTESKQAQSEASAIYRAPYRLIRAKQAGGFGRCPNQPTESPDPADSNHPILPIAIARSCLYQSELQGTLQPPLQPGACDQAVAHLDASWGGGGMYQPGRFQVQFPAAAAPASTAGAEPPPSVTSIERQPLVWPSCFLPEDQPVAMRHLCTVDAPTRQVVLDEIAWMASSGTLVKSPAGLARKLTKLAAEGRLVPEGAHRISAARAAAEVMPTPKPTLPPNAPFTLPDSTVLKALAQTRAKVAGAPAVDRKRSAA